MLTALRIADFAILEAAELELGPGLTAITGETGAGKSILVDALALVLGGRGSDKWIRAGRDLAEIEAQIEGVQGPARAAVQAEVGVDLGDGTLVLRRVLGRGGKGRCYVNGRLVTAAQLRQVAASLVDLSSQHAQHRLLDRESHLDALDRFAGLLPLRRRHEQEHATWRALRDELHLLVAQQRAQEERLDYLRFVHKELSDLAVEPGELAQAQDKLQRIKAAESLVKAAAEASQYLGSEGGARDLVARAARALSRLGHVDPKLADLAERARDLDALAQDLAHDVEHYGRGIDRDERELQRLAERVDALQRAIRKYGGSEEALLERQRQVAAELDTDAAELRVAELQVDVARHAGILHELAGELTVARQTAAPELAAQVTAVVRQLGMPAAEFRVEVRHVADAEPRPHGQDEAEFHLRANRGETGGPLAEVASGGELSRVLLAVQRACSDAALRHAEDEAAATCIYDEADAGLSGSTGLVLGRFLAEVGARQQVLCISHLPQVAAAADHHIRVTKIEQDGRTCSVLTRLGPDERVQELARMLGTVQGEGDTALAHARQLLAQQQRR